MKKVIIIFMLTLLVFLPITNQVYAGTTFKDLDPNQYWWALEAFDFLINKGVIQGYSDGTVKPDNYITKAELLRMIYLLFPDYRPNYYYNYYNNKTIHFLDVQYNHWAYKEISTLITKQDSNIYTTTNYGYKFYPDKELTRIGAVNLIPTFGIKHLEEKQIRVILSQSTDIPISIVSNDVEHEKARNDERYDLILDRTNILFPIIFYKNYDGTLQLRDSYSSNIGEKLAYLMGANIMTPYEGKFNPDDKLTRAQAVTILYRIYQTRLKVQ